MTPRSKEQRDKYEAKICPSCGNSNDRFPKWYCTCCNEKHNEWSRKYTLKKKQKGLCPSCGKLLNNGKSQCNKCLMKYNLLRKKKG